MDNYRTARDQHSRATTSYRTAREQHTRATTSYRTARDHTCYHKLPLLVNNICSTTSYRTAREQHMCYHKLPYCEQHFVLLQVTVLLVNNILVLPQVTALLVITHTCYHNLPHCSRTTYSLYHKLP
ncbi:hypothetical protein J6590_104447, partial [Homalodisca vitripennis]